MKSTSSASVVALILFCLVPATARAGDDEPLGSSLKTTPAADGDVVHPVRVPEPMSSPSSTRITASIGAVLGAYSVGYIPAGSSAVEHDPSAGGGLYGRLGVQVTDLFDLDLEADAAFSPPTDGYFFRAAATVGVTPVDWLTVGVGPVLVFAQQQNGPQYLGGCSFFCLLDGSVVSPAYHYVYLGGTARVDFHLSSHRNRLGREGVILGLAFDVAASVDESTAAGYTCNGFLGGCPTNLPPNQPGTPGYLSEGLFATFGYAFY